MMDADDQDKLETEPAADQNNDQNDDLNIGQAGEAENQPEQNNAGVETITEIVPPPRIVAETPIGGKVRPAPKPRFGAPHEPTAEIESPAGETVPEPQAVLEETPAVEPEAPASEAESVPPESLEVEAPVIEPAAALPEVAPPDAPPAESEIVEEPRPARPAPPPAVVSTSEAAAASVDDWDDDISPELASLLFQPKKSAPREDVKGKDAAVSVSPAETAPAAKSAPPAEPIHLMQIEEARTLPIIAQSVSAPAPHIRPEGKARYQRIEEPLPDDAGQRTREQWDYLEYPDLDGRAVKRVVMDETIYSDGSRRWFFERSYQDGGRESREVRANTDHTYVERVDVIRSKDAVTGKHVKRTEQEAMILAVPIHEEKRGLLSSLLGRGDDDHKGDKTWRAASTHEAGRARKDGGRAFKRKVFGLF